MCKAIKELIEDGRMEGREEGFAAGREDGLTIGREEGRTEGTIRILVDLVHDDMLPVSEAAKRMGITEKEFMETMKAELGSR